MSTRPNLHIYIMTIRHEAVEAREYPDDAIAPELVDRIDSKLAALAWENYLKRRAGDMTEDDARKSLLEELRGRLANPAAKPRSENIALLDVDAAASMEELKQYLSGKFPAGQSRFAKTLLPELARGEDGGIHAREEGAEVSAARTVFEKSKEEVWRLLHSEKFFSLPPEAHARLFNAFADLDDDIRGRARRAADEGERLLLWEEAAVRMEKHRESIEEAFIRNAKPAPHKP